MTKRNIMERLGWTDIGSDVNWQEYGGRWAKQDPNNENVWWVIRSENMFECCGSDWTGDKYHADLARIDLSEISLDDGRRAMDCVGLTLETLNEMSPAVRSLALVEACFSYGIYAPMGQYGSKYAERARAEARNEADFLMTDFQTCEARLDRPVNAIGSTARDFQSGDSLAGLRRYEESGEHGTDTAKDILLKMYGGSVTGVK